MMTIMEIIKKYSGWRKCFNCTGNGCKLCDNTGESIVDECLRCGSDIEEVQEQPSARVRCTSNDCGWWFRF